MHAWINITHPGFSGRQDMPDDGDQWVSWEQMVATLRANGEAEGRAALLAREVVELRGEVAKLKQAPAVVVPDLTDERLRDLIVNAARRCGFVDYDPEDVSAGDLEILREARDDLAELFLAIPSPSARSAGMVAVDRRIIEKFAAGCGEWMPGLGRCGDQYPGGERQLCAKCTQLRDALRANQGGLNHVHV